MRNYIAFAYLWLTTFVRRILILFHTAIIYINIYTQQFLETRTHNSSGYNINFNAEIARNRVQLCSRYKIIIRHKRKRNTQHQKTLCTRRHVSQSQRPEEVKYGGAQEQHKPIVLYILILIWLN